MKVGEESKKKLVLVAADLTHPYLTPSRSSIAEKPDVDSLSKNPSEGSDYKGSSE